MTTEGKIIFSIIAICITFLIIWKVIDNKNTSIVMEKSQRLERLLELNKSTSFILLNDEYCYCHQCNSKRQLDNFSLDNYFMTLIDENENFYKSVIEAITFNRSAYNEYRCAVRSIKSTATEEYCNTFKFSLKKFLKYEEYLFQKNELSSPQTDVTIFCEATYTSPQGRNHYHKEYSYNFAELSKTYQKVIHLKNQKQTRQYQIQQERSRMTDSLRYDILKRDNFRCQICGSTAQDGVKLHVDHIIPVSKGGITTPSNLRALCDRCNMGKSDKM